MEPASQVITAFIRAYLYKGFGIGGTISGKERKRLSAGPGPRSARETTQIICDEVTGLQIMARTIPSRSNKLAGY